MNIRNKRPAKIKAQETESLASGVRQQVKKQKSMELEVMTNPHMQFNFENGVIMGHIKADVNTRIGLKWHFENTNNVDEFIESVRNFVQTSGESLTAKDENRLKSEYNKA